MRRDSSVDVDLSQLAIPEHFGIPSKLFSPAEKFPGSRQILRAFDFGQEFVF